MHISPIRRRRIMRVHFLRQQGMSTRNIAKKLDISHSTVREDLKLIETYWSTIAAAAADDLLLESLQLLNYRLVLALENKAIAANLDRLTPVEYLRAQDAHQTQLSHLAREIRRTAQAVHQRAAQRPDQPALDELDESDEEEPRLHLAKDAPESSTGFHSNSTISSPEQEIVENPTPEEKIPSNPVLAPERGPAPAPNGATPPDQEAVIQEVLTHFPHLRGRSNQQILQFLDQFANPKEEHTQTQAAAAG